MSEEIANQSGKCANERSRYSNVGLGFDVMRHIFEGDPRSDKRNESRRPDIEPALPGGDEMSHLMEKNQCDETDRVRQSVNPGIRKNREKHGASGEEDLAELSAGE